MNLRLVARNLAYLTFALSTTFAVCVPWALYYREFETLPGLFTAFAAGLAIGGGLWLGGRRAPGVFSQREALAVVASTWFVAGLIGALPFVCTGELAFIPALFESVSGFTTTGASILDDVEAMPKTLLFWRSFTHFLGGMGIVIMFIAVLPYLGQGGKQLFRSESTGPDPHGLQPRVRESARALLYIYCGLTLAQTVAYLATGYMDLFESLCHAFGALATGGFSTRQASIAAYDSLTIEIITIVFMLAGGTSFALYFQMLHKPRAAIFRDTEWRVFVLVLAGASLLVAAAVAGAGPLFEALPGGQADPPGFLRALRGAVFSTVSLMTNTGYVTDDFDHWPYAARAILLVLMLIGGCAGSTSSGIKVARFIIVFRMMTQRIELAFRPKTVRALRIGDEVVADAVQQGAAVFVLAYGMCFAASVVVMSGVGLPFDSAVSAVAACMTNTGPGLEWVGASESYSAVPSAGLLYLAFVMILGRLELFTVLVLFVPAFWRVR